VPRSYVDAGLLNRNGLTQVALDCCFVPVDVRNPCKPNLPRGLHVLGLLNQDVLGVLEQSTLHEQQSAIVLEAVDQNDIFTIEVIAGLTPFQFFVESGLESEFAQHSIFNAPAFLLAVDLTDEWIHGSTSGQRCSETEGRADQALTRDHRWNGRLQREESGWLDHWATYAYTCQATHDSCADCAMWIGHRRCCAVRVWTLTNSNWFLWRLELAGATRSRLWQTAEDGRCNQVERQLGGFASNPRSRQLAVGGLPVRRSPARTTRGESLDPVRGRWD
jgi:hypothetical protein